MIKKMIAEKQTDMIFLCLSYDKNGNYPDAHANALALLQKAYKDIYGCPCPRVCKDGNGKPYLENSGVHISVSHCDGLCAVAFSGSNVGVDAECSQRKIPERVSQRFLSGGGIAEWTKLEAYAK